MVFVTAQGQQCNRIKESEMGWSISRYETDEKG
jgi:hypothetical protein